MNFKTPFFKKFYYSWNWKNCNNIGDTYCAFDATHFPDNHHFALTSFFRYRERTKDDTINYCLYKLNKEGIVIDKCSILDAIRSTKLNQL
jgi:hypothetical protein